MLKIWSVENWDLSLPTNIIKLGANCYHQKLGGYQKVGIKWETALFVLHTVIVLHFTHPVHTWHSVCDMLKFAKLVKNWNYDNYVRVYACWKMYVFIEKTDVIFQFCDYFAQFSRRWNIQVMSKKYWKQCPIQGARASIYSRGLTFQEPFSPSVEFMEIFTVLMEIP